MEARRDPDVARPSRPSSEASSSGGGSRLDDQKSLGTRSGRSQHPPDELAAGASALMHLRELVAPSGTSAVPGMMSPGDGSWTGLTDRLSIAWYRAPLVVRLPVCLALAALVAFGAWWLLRTPPLPSELAMPTVTTSRSEEVSGSSGGAPNERQVGAQVDAANHSPGDDGSGAGSLAVANSSSAGVILAHAAGAVVKPGVYRLASGSRVADLMAAAGGSTPDADLNRINLAAVLDDGMQVYVLRIGEAEPPPLHGPSGGGTTGGDSSDSQDPGQTSPLDLNTATPDELDELPGIGPATAAAIVDHRTKHGPFESVESLLDVRGIGMSKLDAIADLVTVMR